MEAIANLQDIKQVQLKLYSYRRQHPFRPNVNYMVGLQSQSLDPLFYILIEVPMMFKVRLSIIKSGK